jgi:hypothetical protein
MAWMRRMSVLLLAVLVVAGCEVGTGPAGDPGGGDGFGTDSAHRDAVTPDSIWPDLQGADTSGPDWGDVPAAERIVYLKVWQPTASPGDIVGFTGLGFHPDPARNIFRFAGGVTTAPLSVEPATYTDYTNQQLVMVAIPDGAQSGSVAARRNDMTDWSEPVEMTIRPAAVITLSPGWESAGIYIPGYGIGQPDPSLMPSDEPYINCAMGAGSHVHSWCWLADVNWVLGGSGYSALTPGGSAFGYGLKLDLTLPDGSTAQWQGYAFDDSTVVFGTSQWDLKELLPGDMVTLQVSGVEHGGHHLRRSNTLVLPASLLMRLGASRLLRLMSMGTASPDEAMQMSPGDILVVRGDTQPRQVTAPGLWDGSIDFRCHFDEVHGADAMTQEGEHLRLCTRHFVIPGPGDYVVTDVTNGKARLIQVPAGGVVGGGASVSGNLVAQEGVILGFGGGRLTIPPDALPLHDGSGRYTVGAAHVPQDKPSWDPEATDRGSIFKVNLWPEPDELLKPITIVLPYDPAAYAEAPVLGIQDPESGLFWNMGGTVNEADHTITVELPAGTYAEPQASPAVPRALIAFRKMAPGTPAPPPGRLNRLLGSLVAWGSRSTRGLEVDTARKIQVDYITDPASSSYSSTATATRVLAIAVTVYDHLQGLGWTIPDSTVTLYLRDMGNPDSVKGSTTKGVFGQPWVTINSRLSGVPMDTTVAHEMGHVFQRQLTTNIITHWFDEAVAQWVAVDALGAGADIGNDITGAADFPATSLPSTFQFGYDTDQGYAAGALAIWLERQSSGCLLKIYQALEWSPSNWADAHGVLTSECGQTPGALVYDFGEDYWTQTFPPVQGLAIGASPKTWSDWAGISVPASVAKLASTRLDVRFDPTFKPSLAGRQVVARLSNPGDTVVRIHGDTVPPTAPVGTLTDLATLSSGRGAVILGDVSAFTSMRAVIIHPTSSASTNPTLRIVAPHVAQLVPSQGRPSGGYTVTVNGTGFGNSTGKAYVSGFAQTVNSWADGSVTFQMFNAGTSQGEWDVRLETVEGASTNTMPFLFVP